LLLYIQAFVSEYAVWKEDAGAGSLYAAVAEAAFLIGLEKNRFWLYITIVIAIAFHEN